MDGLNQRACSREPINIRPIFVADPETDYEWVRLEQCCSSANYHLRSVRVQHKALKVERQSAQRRQRNRHLRVCVGGPGEAALRCTHSQGIQPSRCRVLALGVEQRVAVRQLQRLLCGGEAEGRRAIVRRQHKVNVVLTALVVDCPVAICCQTLISRCSRSFLHIEAAVRLDDQSPREFSAAGCECAALDCDTASNTTDSITLRNM